VTRTNLFIVCLALSPLTQYLVNLANSALSVRINPNTRPFERSRATHRLGISPGGVDDQTSRVFYFYENKLATGRADGPPIRGQGERSKAGDFVHIECGACGHDGLIHPAALSSLD